MKTKSTLRRFVAIFSILTIAVLTMVVMVACGGGNGKNAPDPVTDIRYDGNTITWAKSNGATKYSVLINDQTSTSTGGTSFVYSNKTNQPFSVKITAVNEAGKSSAIAEKTFAPLDEIKEIRIDDNGVASWNGVEGASGYVMWLDGQEYTIYDLSYDQLNAGKHQMKVKPFVESSGTGTEYYAKFSDVKTFTICNDVASDSIRYNMSSGRIEWGSVADAASYAVSVNGATVVNDTVTTNSYEYNPMEMNFVVTVRALGNKTTTIDSRNAAEKSFTYLEGVKNLRLQDGILLWDEVKDATGYRLRLNNSQVIETKECSYSGLPIKQSVQIEIMPICDGSVFFTSWSAPDNYKILQSPVLQWTGKFDAFDGSPLSAIAWDAIDSAQGYTVRVVYTHPDGTVDSPVETVLSATTVGFENDFLEVGTYTLQVKSNSPENDPNLCDSLYSDPIRVIRLAPPKMNNNAIVSTNDKLQDGFTANFNPVSRAVGYQIWKDHSKYQIVNNNQFKEYNVVSEDVIMEQNIEYGIQSLGRDIANEQGIPTVVLNSLPSENVLFQIKVLAAPAVHEMAGYTFSYDQVYGAFGYNVAVNGRANACDNTTHELNYLEAGTYTVTVCAKGNGADVLASNYSAPLTIYRVIAPYDIHVITEGASEGVLAFSSDPNASGSGFEMYIDGSTSALPVDELTNMKQLITTKGTELFMRAVANVYNDSRTIYYMTSLPSETMHIKKLSAPSFGDNAFTNNQMIWNSSSGAIRYEVYNAQDVMYGSFEGASMPLDSLEGGQDYTFKVRSIGDGITSFNSDYSEGRSVYKLKTPAIFLEGNQGYVWDAVSGATSYAVYIDGALASTDVHVSGNIYSFVPNFTELKTYKVEIYAIGDGGATTINSSPFTVEQETIQLETPDFSFSYSNDCVSPDGEIIVTITHESPSANGYNYTIGGISKSSSDSVFRYNPNGAGSFPIRVYALGGAFNEDGVYCLDSQNCGGNASYTYNLLYKVDETALKLSNDGRLTWTAISGATGYTLHLTINGEEQDLVKVNNAAYDLTNIMRFSNIQTLTVRLQATGGSKTVASAETVKEWTGLH